MWFGIEQIVWHVNIVTEFLLHIECHASKKSQPCHCSIISALLKCYDLSLLRHIVFNRLDEIINYNILILQESFIFHILLTLTFYHTILYIKWDHTMMKGNNDRWWYTIQIGTTRQWLLWISLCYVVGVGKMMKGEATRGGMVVEGMTCSSI